MKGKPEILDDPGIIVKAFASLLQRVHSVPLASVWIEDQFVETAFDSLESVHLHKLVPNLLRILARRLNSHDP